MTTDSVIDVPDRLYEVIRPYLRSSGGASISPDSDLRSMGLDSMQAIELLFAIEDEFGHSIADSKMTDKTFSTPGNLWSAMRESSGSAS